ncbi:MAG: desulfoferrodoxin FeS4 iron-binding domain-containing protein [Candidatus Aenigmatarchaeota archaeon]
MGVREKGEIYRCNICGNEIKVTYVGGGNLVCCSKPMELIKEGVPEEEEEEVQEQKEEEENWGNFKDAQETKEGEIEEDMNKGFAG